MEQFEARDLSRIESALNDAAGEVQRRS